MTNYLLIGLGGFVGSTSRYYLSNLVLTQLPLGKLPVGTLAVNLFGCLLIGLLSVVLDQPTSNSETWRLFVLTGILGGFTTFSAFGLETCSLLKSGDTTLALANILISVLGGIAMVLLGNRLLS